MAYGRCCRRSDRVLRCEEGGNISTSCCLQSPVVRYVLPSPTLFHFGNIKLKKVIQPSQKFLSAKRTVNKLLVEKELGKAAGG